MEADYLRLQDPLTVTWNWFADTVSGGREKADHAWQQPVPEAEHYIKVFCPEGGIVFDPMVGSGTTLVAAKGLGRRWLGCEIKDEDAENARMRLAEMDVSEGAA